MLVPDWVTTWGAIMATRPPWPVICEPVAMPTTWTFTTSEPGKAKVVLPGFRKPDVSGAAVLTRMPPASTWAPFPKIRPFLAANQMLPP